MTTAVVDRRKTGVCTCGTPIRPQQKTCLACYRTSPKTRTRVCSGCGSATSSTYAYCKPCLHNNFADELEMLLSAGEGWGAISARFGVQPKSVETRLYRMGRKDLLGRWLALFPPSDFSQKEW